MLDCPETCRVLAISEQAKVGRFDDVPAEWAIRGFRHEPRYAKHPEQRTPNEEPQALPAFGM